MGEGGVGKRSGLGWVWKAVEEMKASGEKRPSGNWKP